MSGQHVSYSSRAIKQTLSAGENVEITTQGNTTTIDSPSCSVYYHYPVSGDVLEQDAVMSVINNGNGQAPLYFIKGVGGGNSYYPAEYGIAKNVSGGYADIYIGKGCIVPGFNFGAYVGVDYYLDDANPGKLTWTAPVVGSSVNAIKIGRAMDSSHLILDPIGNFVQEKGGLYTSDGTYDEVFPPGANGTVLMYDSTQPYGLKASNTLAPKAAPVFTGDVNSSTGNVLISTLGKGLQIKSGTNAKIGQATLVAGTKLVANTSVTANSRIFLSVSSAGGTQGFLKYTKVNGTSFTITSSSSTETSVVDWIIIESL